MSVVLHQCTSRNMSTYYITIHQDMDTIYVSILHQHSMHKHSVYVNILQKHMSTYYFSVHQHIHSVHVSVHVQFTSTYYIIALPKSFALTWLSWQWKSQNTYEHFTSAYYINICQHILSANINILQSFMSAYMFSVHQCSTSAYTFSIHYCITWTYIRI